MAHEHDHDAGTALTAGPQDDELKARHRAMWATGDYPSMVEAYLLPLGPRLVEGCGVREGQRVLDVAAGTGNSALPAARRGARVTACDLTPELLEAGRAQAATAGLELTWVEGDAERLPFADASFDVVMSSIGAMFAPDHARVADELVRVCAPGGTIGMLNWTPEGFARALFTTLSAFTPPPPPGAQLPWLWGTEDHLQALFGARVELTTLEHDALSVTAFARPGEFAEHLRKRMPPTVVTRSEAAGAGREAEFDQALEELCADWDRGGPGHAAFAMEYLLAVGTRS